MILKYIVGSWRGLCLRFIMGSGRLLSLRRNCFLSITQKSSGKRNYTLIISFFHGLSPRIKQLKDEWAQGDSNSRPPPRQGDVIFGTRGMTPKCNQLDHEPNMIDIANNHGRISLFGNLGTKRRSVSNSSETRP